MRCNWYKDCMITDCLHKEKHRELKFSCQACYCRQRREVAFCLASGRWEMGSFGRKVRASTYEVRWE